MNKLFILIFFLLFLSPVLYGQNTSRATASTSVELIEPIGIEKSGELILNSYMPKNESGILEIGKTGILVNGLFILKDRIENADTPYFTVITGQSSFAITVTYSPEIKNKKSNNATMQIKSLDVLQEDKKNNRDSDLEKFSINAKIQIGHLQAPGLYLTPNPYAVTIHFN